MSDAAAPTGGRPWPRWIRWLHLYGSMLGLMATLLFAVTGFTLNHADWFERKEPFVREFAEETAPAAKSSAGKSSAKKGDSKKAS